jgi:hypothetical protein
MNLMVAPSIIDYKHAHLMSRLCDNPINVVDDVFMWHGYVVDRVTAVLCLLKIYSQLPVNDKMKLRMYKNYMDRWASNRYAVTSISSDPNAQDPVARSSVWFYRLCRKLKGNVQERSAENIKDILVLLHT